MVGLFLVCHFFVGRGDAWPLFLSPCKTPSVVKLTQAAVVQNVNEPPRTHGHLDMCRLTILVRTVFIISGDTSCMTYVLLSGRALQAVAGR